MLWSTAGEERRAGAARAVLNPLLYAQLRGKYRDVRVCNPGERARAGAPLIDRRTGEASTRFIDGGEYYAVSCPYCGDTRHRLYVNHQWLCPDPLSGRPMHYLAYCFNADCLKRHYRDFYDSLFDDVNYDERELLAMMRRVPAPEVGVESPPGPMGWPGDVLPLAELSPIHPARAYLEGRGFDARELAERWGVVYCRRGEGMHTAATGRILAPFLRDGVQVGWQGRWPGELDWKATGITKYHTPHGFPKSRVLYNHDLAARGRVVVVVEGVTDVWAVGPEAVAILGKKVHQAQRVLLDRWAAAGGLLALMLDATAWTDEEPDAAVAAERRAVLCAELSSQFAGRFVEVALPGRADPGSLARPVLWRVIRAAATARGIDLASFGKDSP